MKPVMVGDMIPGEVPIVFDIPNKMAAYWWAISKWFTLAIKFLND